MSITKPYKTLYVKKATGKTQQWDISVIKEKDDVFLCSQYGEIGGKLISRKSQILTTKANRTLFDEALKQAETKYNQKVNKEGYTGNKEDTALVIRPMLATKFNPAKTNMKFPTYGEPKYDGNRGIAYMKDGKVVLESRNGTQIHYFDHIREEVQDLLKSMPSGFYLDGELFTHDLPFNVINGLINRKPSTVKLTPKKIAEHKASDKLMDKVKYYIFDCFNVKNLSMKMEDRKALLDKLFKGKKYKYLELVKGKELKNIEDVKIHHDEYIKNGGYEGIMLRAYGSPYELKKRSKYLQKYKEFQDEEFTIIGFEKDADNGVVWTVETNIKPKSQFNVRPKGDMEYRTEMYKNADKYIGAKLIVVFQEYTDDTHGVPRFPVGKDIRSPQDLD